MRPAISVRIRIGRKLMRTAEEWARSQRCIERRHRSAIRAVRLKEVRELPTTQQSPLTRQEGSANSIAVFDSRDINNVQTAGTNRCIRIYSQAGAAAD